MFKENYQGSLKTVFYSVGSKPLTNWTTQCKDGDFLHVVLDENIKSNVLEIRSQNVSACLITTPEKPKGSLAIQLPFFTMLVKNLDSFFTAEVTISDDQKIRRRFRISNYSKTTRVSMHMCSMPVTLAMGWNQITLNMAELTSRMYSTCFVEIVRVQVHANCRLRRVYFSDKVYTDDELPEEYRKNHEKKLRVKPEVSQVKKKVVKKKIV